MTPADNKRRFKLFPQTLAQCIEPVTRPLLKPQGLAGSRILTEWELIVGATLSRRCVPEKLTFPPARKTDGNLTIAVENGFALEVQHMQPVILERLAVYFGYKAVSRITISPRALMAMPPTPLPAFTPPLPATCKAMAEEITDPLLKEAFAALAKTLCE